MEDMLRLAVLEAVDVLLRPGVHVTVFVTVILAVTVGVNEGVTVADLLAVGLKRGVRVVDRVTVRDGVIDELDVIDAL